MTTEQFDRAMEIKTQIASIQKKIDRNNDFVKRVNQTTSPQADYVEIKLAEGYYATPIATVSKTALLAMIEAQRYVYESEIAALNQEMENL